MAARSALASTEAKVFHAYWQDGILDLIAGAGAVLIGVGWVLGYVLSVVLVPALVLTAWPILRRRITDPRLGRVRFSARRRFTMLHGMIAVVSLGILLGGLTVTHVYRGTVTSQLVRWLAPGIPALILAALSLSAAAALGLLRFVGYAGGFVAAALLAAVLDADPGWAILLGGAVVCASGAVMLSRFLREFPPLAGDLDQ